MTAIDERFRPNLEMARPKVKFGKVVKTPKAIMKESQHAV